MNLIVQYLLTVSKYFSSSYCISKWPRKLHFTFWFVFLLQASSNLLLPAPSSLSPHSKLRLPGTLSTPLNPLYAFTTESGKCLYFFTLSREWVITSMRIFFSRLFKFCCLALSGSNPILLYVILFIKCSVIQSNTDACSFVMLFFSLSCTLIY